MSTDARAALEQLVAALRSHLETAEQRRSERDPAVEAAYRRLAEAFETYDEILYDAYDEVTPFVLYDDVEDEREDAEFDDELDDDLDDSDLDDVDESDVDDELDDIDETDLDDEDDDEVLEDLEESEVGQTENGAKPYSDTSSRA
ncbi:MAG TPA: DNA primase [Actinomycetales bacterium]|nr:DNA primase [Actinomycetales bacterium]